MIDGRMNPQWKQKWLDALRSGKYSQDKGFLKSSYGFCCLGVLCDIAGTDEDYHPNTEKWSLLQQSSPDLKIYSLYGDHSTHLPEYIMNKTGIIRSNGLIDKLPNKWGELNSGFSLAELNDEGFTFDQIADVIEYFF